MLADEIGGLDPEWIQLAERGKLGEAVRAYRRQYPKERFYIAIRTVLQYRRHIKKGPPGPE